MRTKDRGADGAVKLKNMMRQQDQREEQYKRLSKEDKAWVDRRQGLHYADRQLAGIVRDTLTKAGEPAASPILLKLSELRLLVLRAHEEAVGATARIDYDFDDGDWVP